jgi:hypothetical protein
MLESASFRTNLFMSNLEPCIYYPLEKRVRIWFLNAHARRRFAPPPFERPSGIVPQPVVLLLQVEAAFVQVEHVGDGPARDMGGDVRGELGGSGLHRGRRLALTPFVCPSVDLNCLLKISSADGPFCPFGGREFRCFASCTTADPDDAK